GVGVLLVLIPLVACGLLNVPFAVALQKFQLQSMCAQDKRLKFTSEILNNMKIIKLQSWCEKEVDRIKKQFDDCMAFLLSEHFLQPLALEKKWQADHICKTIATFLSEMKNEIDYKYSKGTFGRENFKDQK
ncbi:ABC transporter C family member 8-like protein, partial [Tanacetum coccineum]